MPKAAMDEQHCSLLWKDDIGTARKRFVMPSALDSDSPKKCVCDLLWPGVSGSYARHELTSLTWRQRVM